MIVMSCVIRQFGPDEITDNSNVTAGTPRMQRLKDLVCGGSWGNADSINLIYWKPDPSAPDGGYWVAWEDPDPLPAAGVSIAP